MLDNNPNPKRQCDRLAKERSVERELDPSNQRQVLIRLRQAGLDLLLQMDPVFEQHANTNYNLPDEKVEDLSRLPDKLRG